MKIEQLTGFTKEQLLEMDKSQKGPPGWNISDDEPGKPEIHLGPEKLMKAKDVVKSAAKTLNKTMGKAHKKVKEGFGGRDAYQRDYDSSVSGFGRQHREIDDEANLMYIYRDGRVRQRMISNHEERSAHREGFRDSIEGALRLHNIIRSKFDPKKWVQKQGTQWVQVHPFGKPEDVAESATAGATSAANIGTVDAPQLSPGKARGKKSYTGTPGHSGTKAPPQPKVVQPKTSMGTAVNALDMKGKNIFGQAAESTIIKRR